MWNKSTKIESITQFYFIFVLMNSSKKSLKITFLGTGTSQGIPMIASKDPVCLSTDPKDKRLRSSILFSFDGEHRRSRTPGCGRWRPGASRVRGSTRTRCKSAPHTSA